MSTVMDELRGRVRGELALGDDDSSRDSIQRTSQSCWFLRASSSLRSLRASRRGEEVALRKAAWDSAATPAAAESDESSPGMLSRTPRVELLIDFMPLYPQPPKPS